MEQHPLKLKITGRKMLTSKVLQLTFIRSDGMSLLFIPGQFITLLLPDGLGNIVRRSYSLANNPEQPLAIAIEPVKGGVATTILFNLHVGDELLCIGPKGRLILHNEEVNHYLLVATNTGVTPYRAMLQTLSKRLLQNNNLHVTLLLGVPYAKDLLYKEDFLNFAQAHPHFSFRAYLSRENTCEVWYHYAGYVHSAFDHLPLNPMTDLVYLCGNPHMIDESIDKLNKIGFHPDRIRHEKYASSNVVPK